MARILALEIICFILYLSGLSGQTSEVNRLAATSVLSPKPSIGKPLIRSYSPKEYLSAPQCWDIVQAPDGLIYMSNNSHELLEYDGVSWEPISFSSSINKAILAVSGQGLVYLGHGKDFGYLAPDSVGRLQFNSLLPQLDRKDREELDIHHIAADGDQIYFLSGKKIFRWNGRQMRSWKSKTRFAKGQFSGGVFYAYQEDTGLFSIRGDSLILFPTDVDLAKRYVYGIMPFTEATASLDEYPPMILALEDGLHLLKGRRLSYIDAPASRFYKGKILNSTVVLPDNLFGLCTSKGAIVFDAAGNIIQELDESNGLPSDVVYNMSADREGGLWLTTLQGVCRVNSIRPIFTLFDKSKGLHGVVSSNFIRHNGTIYVRTSSGIYAQDALNGRFELVDGLSGLDWSIFKLEDQLYAVRTSLRRIEGKKSTWVKNLKTRAFKAFTSTFLSNSVFLSCMGKDSKGIFLLRKKESEWEEIPLLDNTPGSSFMMVEEPGGVLWTTQFGKGVIRLKLTQEGNLLEVKRYSTNHGLPNSVTEVISTSKGPLFYGESGLLDFNEQTQRFLPSNRFEFPPTGNEFPPITWLEDPKGNFWTINYGKNGAFPSVFRRTREGKYELDKARFKRLSTTGLYNIIAEADSIVWFGGERGLFRYDDKRRKNYAVDFKAMARRVTVSKGGEGKDFLVFGGVNTRREPLTLAFSDNSLRIEFAAASLEAPSATQYRFFLENFDRDWSEWTYETQKDYTQLPEGNYTFRVMAKNIYDRLSREDQISIRILPPWYRTFWAYLCYVLAGFSSLIMIVYAYNKFRTQQLKNRNRELEKTVLEKTVELRQSNEKLIALDQLKSRFFTDISHEFRTPLTVISGMSEQIIDNPDQWSLKGGILIRRNSAALLDLVTQILDLRKLEVGKLQLKLVQADVIPYLIYIIESFTSLAKNRGVGLSFHTDQKALIMDYDPEKLLRIVSNLLSNAIKFTPAGGTVAVQASMKKDGSQDQFILQVKDDGVGISPEKLPFIFDRFYQIDTNEDPPSGSKSGGFGVGLALIRELIKLMGGEIGVESRLGKGTHFTVSLPIKRTAEIKMEMEGSEIATGRFSVPRTSTATVLSLSSGSRQGAPLPTLLIVEDNPDVMQYLVACLEDRFQLSFAKDGQEGVETAFRQSPDIILSDVMMPRKDGFELCQTLKLDQRTSHIPIVLLTAKADVESRIAGLKRGADAYLAKPFNKQELLLSLQKLVELRRRLQERYSRNEIPQSSEDPRLQIEDAFMQKVREIVEQHIDDENFGAPELARTLNMSRSSFYAKIKALTNSSPALLIRLIRLQHAKELLRKTDLNISQIALEVGFNNPSYFSRCFAQEFNRSPKQFRAGLQK